MASNLAKKFRDNWGKDVYKSYRGGGTPAGEKNAFGEGVRINPAGEKRKGWHKVGQPGHREEEQPRDKNGQFTYNSMIGKELKDISKKNGKSRGTSIPPIFNGGYNGGKGSAVDRKVLEGTNGKKYNVDHFEEGSEEVEKYGPFEKGQVVAIEGKLKIAPVHMYELAKEWIVENVFENITFEMISGKDSYDIVEGKKGEADKIKNIRRGAFFATDDNGNKIKAKPGEDQINGWKLADFSSDENGGAFGRSKARGKRTGAKEAKFTENSSTWATKPGRRPADKELKDMLKTAPKSGALYTEDGKPYTYMATDKKDDIITAKTQQEQAQRAREAKAEKEIEAAEKRYVNVAPQSKDFDEEDVLIDLNGKEVSYAEAENKFKKQYGAKLLSKIGRKDITKKAPQFVEERIKRNISMAIPSIDTEKATLEETITIANKYKIFDDDDFMMDLLNDLFDDYLYEKYKGKKGDK